MSTVTETGTDIRPFTEETEEEKAAVAAMAEFRATGFGYFIEQSTRPQAGRRRSSRSTRRSSTTPSPPTCPRTRRR